MDRYVVRYEVGYGVLVDMTRAEGVVCEDTDSPEDATLGRNFAPLVDELNRLAGDLAAERARAHDAINQLAKETAYSDVLKAVLDLVALVLHPDKSPDEAWTYSTGDLPVMARDLRARAERAEAERDDLRCLLRAREEWIHGRLGDGCPHSGCPQCDAAFPAEAFGLAPGFGYSLIDAARKLASERDVAQAKVAEQARYLLADEERRKLTGDALYAEGKLAEQAARLAKLEAVAEAARVMIDAEGCDFVAYGCACFATAKADTNRALAALEGGG